EKDKDTIIRTERYSGSYQRSISLPENANADNIKAKFENGVLSLTIPKREPTPKKEITIE
ncbi:MAG: Hsp20/alpha crystallin family protein, partial [Candidatus Cloacimonetes bacterium]|nr:Hsp20/alpha crystallin family protein [Candidatus Cloacimonadota bacterium]